MTIGGAAARALAHPLLVLLVLWPLAGAAEEEPTTVTVTGRSTPGATRPSKADLAGRRAVTDDATELLRGVPGVAVAGAGGISSLPVVDGLADDRLRVQVDGVDLTPACPNHMNAALSYAAPAQVASVTVFSGVAPVSVGGDSIGGAILVKAAPPLFAGEDQAVATRGQAGGFYRTNGQARGYDLDAAVAGRWLSLSFSQSGSSADDFRAGRSFKDPAAGREGGRTIPGDEVGSSAYRGSVKRALGLALQRPGHLLRLELGQQTVGFEGFPNQRMDMTSNDNRVLSVRYTGQFGWGELEGLASYQRTRHRMDMGPDRFAYGTGMPMKTRATTRSAGLTGTVPLGPRETLRLGAELQDYTLFDWWPPVGGSMGPNDLWNVDYGQRRRLGAFAEWEARWSGAWLSLVGLRGDTVFTDAGPVQGYDNGLSGAWGDDAAAFNARRRARTDHNWGLTALLRWTPAERQSWELGYSRATRSPNLYQRYPWSTNAMAAVMNNFVGDGNGYVGNVDLRPEVAHTVALNGSWQTDEGRWALRGTAHATYVQGYIDARRCGFGQCSAANQTATDGFVLLQYANQSARLLGLNLSGRLPLGTAGALGSFAAAGTFSWVRGWNPRSGDDLYGIMPPNAVLSVVHRLGTWAGTAELVAVADKARVSRVRNELRTGGYCLVNLRGSYQWERLRLDLGVDNLLDRLYFNPLGGAYVGQGATMTPDGTPWGVQVPGPGRSINAALHVSL